VQLLSFGRQASALVKRKMTADIPEPGTPKGTDLMPVVIAHSHPGFGIQQSVSLTLSLFIWSANLGVPLQQ
jgi:hypothetical protein